jgi:hypothetical protein
VSNMITKLFTLLVYSISFMCLSYGDEEKSHDFDPWDLGQIKIIAVPEKSTVRIDEQVKVSVYLINDSAVDCKFKIAGFRRDNDELEFSYDLKHETFKYDKISIMEIGSGDGHVMILDSNVNVYVKAKKSICIRSDIIVTPFSGKDTTFAVFGFSFHIDNIERKSNDFTFHLQN